MLGLYWGTRQCAWRFACFKLTNCCFSQMFHYHSDHENIWKSARNRSRVSAVVIRRSPIAVSRPAGGSTRPSLRAPQDPPSGLHKTLPQGSTRPSLRAPQDPSSGLHKTLPWGALTRARPHNIKRHFLYTFNRFMLNLDSKSNTWQKRFFS
jgi:hypothetical protein